MKKTTTALLVIAISMTIGGFMRSVRAEHSGGDVTFNDYNNKSITVGTSVPYSPKLTCAPNSAGGCHKSYVDFFELDNIYESHIGQALKDHGPGTASYLVPYPQHGVTAGYHQMGRNMKWGDVQRNYYGLFAFTSSSGMYGKYCPPSDRQLAHPDETDASRFDMSSYDFAHTECAWCHPGGGSLEYDRSGYRYDGVYGGLLRTAGFNPGLLADGAKGDYYTYVPGVGLESRAAAWVGGGVVEFDCLICHYSRQYANVERNWGIAQKPVPAAGYSSPKLAPSLGLVGVKGQSGILTIGQKAAAGTNPNIDPAQWKWKTEVTNQFNYARISKTSFNRIPATENCAICHFEDGSWTDLGPAGVSLGSTVFQRLIAAGDAADGDETGINGTDGLNDVPWIYAKKRAEYGKRIGSINDPSQNPDVHMDRGMSCLDCHYIVEDTFSAIYDADNNEILPEVTIYRIDHMFAKGNNSPDGRNMDQIANTVTCESCHITGAHPRVDKTQPDGKWYLSGTSREIKIPTHTGFPSFHFGRVDCRACHIPELRTDVKENVIDHTAGTYRGYERTQVSTGGGGIVYRPLYTPRLREKGVVRILPTITMTSAVWVNGAEDKPAFQRLAAQSAEAYRLFKGDADSNGVYDWPLNRAQNSDTALIVNKADEIAWMVGNLKTLGVGEPVMNLYVNAFTVSHNVVPTASGKIIGSPKGGVCLMCHASADPNNIYYSKYAVGFFDKKHVLFDQPQDGGGGLVQTVVNDTSGSPLKRVKMQFKTSDIKGNPLVIDIAGITPAGGTVPNTLDQRAAMGYDSAYLASLIAPGTAGVEMPSAYFTVKADAVVSRKMNFDGSASVCRPSTAICTYTWDFGGAGTLDLADPIKPAFIYDAVGQYSVKLIVSNDGTQGVHAADVTAANVNLKPVVAYTMTLSGMTVTFVDSSTDDDRPLTVKIIWGNGTATSGTGGATFMKTYKYAGVYTINYTVTDATGASATRSEVVTLPQ